MMQIASRYPLPESVYESIALRIYTPILMNENVVLALPPLYGKDHLVRYLWERNIDRTRVFENHINSYYFTLIPLAFSVQDDITQWTVQLLQGLGVALPIPTLENLKSVIESFISDQKHPVFIVNIPETMPDEQIQHFLSFAQAIYYLAPNKVHFIIILDQQWDKNEFIRLIAPFRSLCQHVIEPPLYRDEEVQHFIQYWTSTWRFPIPKDTESLLVKEAGGILLFAKAAIRIAKQNDKSTFRDIKQLIQTDKDYKLQVELFWARLTVTQQQILSNLKEHPEAERLRAMRVLDLTPHGYRIRSASLQRFIDPNLRTTDQIYHAIEARVRLSPTEQILLKLFLSNENQTVSRHTIANAIDKSGQGSLSDWALDQTVSRLRKKLASPDSSHYGTIVTKKGQGFRFQIL